MVGPTFAKRLAKLEIRTVEDLIYHVPHRYLDVSMVSQIGQVQAGETVTVTGQVVAAKNIFTKRGKRIQEVTIRDGTGQLTAVWFNQPYLVTTFKKAGKISLAGTVDRFGAKLSMTTPEYEIITRNKKQETRNKLGSIHTGRLVPIYPETYGVSSKWLRSRIAPILIDANVLIADWLPEPIRTREKLLPLPQALISIHFPDNETAIDTARKRLAFDELFLLQLASQKRKWLWQKVKLSHPLAVDQEKVSQLIAALPFNLTLAQNRVVKEILSDLGRSLPMNRLLQGDVGSGKTVVAAIAMYVAYLNNLKSALLAPTEILALQHAQTLNTILEPKGLTLSTQTGSRKDKLENANIFIGTHALLYRDIPKELGLLVVDEQHRFGVEQRAKLLKASKTPHLLTMTATPIPRTIALTIYGELDLSLVDEMPSGRKAVKTWVVPQLKRLRGYDWIRKQIQEDKVQVFIVCPLIEESESEGLTQVKAAEAEFKRLSKEVFPDLRLGLLHGRMRSKEKTAVISEFLQKKLDILVSTPVIEVGIDIPNATIMVIEGAERFGLAQLHQLRGRVGRAEKQSYCLLFTSKNGGATQRLKAMEKTQSGFTLAELDLKLRGPGELYGLRQHGYLRLKVANFSDQALMSKTHDYARELCSYDPDLKKYPALAKKLDLILSAQIEPN